MPDSGNISPTNAQNIGDAGAGEWTDLSSVFAEDAFGARTNSFLTPQDSDILRLTGYNYTNHVPVGFTITGIECEVIARILSSDGASPAGTIAVQLRRDGADIGDSKETGALVFDSDWTSHTLGGSSDLWGTTGLTTGDLQSGDPVNCDLVLTSTGDTSLFQVNVVHLKVYWSDANRLMIRDAGITVATGGSTVPGQLASNGFGFINNTQGTLLTRDNG